jgi:Zn2+/Cd2+-exporting ATPase
MDCAEEVAILKREVGPVVGGTDRISFDVLRGRMTVSEEAAAIETRRVVEAVARTGMRAQPWHDDVSIAESHAPQQRFIRTILTALSGGAIVTAAVVHAWISRDVGAVFGFESSVAPWGARVFYGVGVIAGVWFVAPKAWYAVRRLRPDMNLLMTIAVLGAVGIDQWFEAAMVAFLFSLSLLLESWSVGRARRAVAALLEMAPATVRLQRADGSQTTVSPGEVGVGSSFVVTPGERIPLDGEVIQGNSHVNQAPITGESQPVEKQPSDAVFAGTINGDGALIVRSTKSAEQTTLANIIRLVGEAHSRKAPSEQWVEKFARVYTPAVMGLALAVLVVPPLVWGQPWGYWFYNALVLLVIACPCALVISTPVSIVAALTTAARHGVLVKGGVFMEAPARLRAIAFDKTGTLTAGKPKVTQIVPYAGHDARELLKIAASMESQSEHLLGRAIVDHAVAEGVTLRHPENFQALQGKGARATLDGKRFWLGSHRYLEERQQETPEICRDLVRLSDAGHSIVIVGNDQHVCGLIALADTLRPTTQAALHELRALGVTHLVMLTGDNTSTASAIAAHIGMDEVHSELLPQDKIAEVEALVAKYGAVAMVGDGVNDAPALAMATLGIAMGAAGTDAAIETADIALMTDDLSRLPWLLHHSRRTLTVIRQNITFALTVKAVFVTLTFAGMASLWGAIAADMGASLLVIFNGMRLLSRPR